MVYKQKHIDQTMSLMDKKLRHGGRYVHYYFDMDRTASTVFSDFYNTNSRNISSAAHRMDSVYGSQNRNRHDTVCRPTGFACSRRLSSLLSRCPMEHGEAVAAFDENACQDILSKRIYHTGSGRYFVSPQRQKSQRSRMVERCRPFDPKRILLTHGG